MDHERRCRDVLQPTAQAPLGDRPHQLRRRRPVLGLEQDGPRPGRPESATKIVGSGSAGAVARRATWPPAPGEPDRTGPSAADVVDPQPERVDEDQRARRARGRRRASSAASMPPVEWPTTSTLPSAPASRSGRGRRARGRRGPRTCVEAGRCAVAGLLGGVAPGGCSARRSRNGGAAGVALVAVQETAAGARSPSVQTFTSNVPTLLRVHGRRAAGSRRPRRRAKRARDALAG